MKIAFLGTGAFGLPALEALSKKYTLVAVVTAPDKPGGRDLKPQPTAVKRWALEHAANLVEFKDEASCADALEKLSPDVLVVISFGHLLKKRLLGLAKTALNVHGSLLPRWRGASPMQSSILHGDPESGVSVMRMAEALDAGDVLHAKTLKLDPRETILSLEPKLMQLGAEALAEALDLLENGKARWAPQDDSKATFCAKIKKEDGKLDWKEEAVTIDRKVRAFLRWPGVFAFMNGKRLLIKKCRVAAEKGEPGRIGSAGNEGIAVATGKGILVLEELQMEGRKPMAAAEFLRGFPLKPGDSFDIIH